MNSNISSSFQIKPGGVISGRIIVPGDKSISHRALMLGAIAEGNTTITGFLQGEDTLATAKVLRQMGVKIENDGKLVRINGVGLNGLNESNISLDLGNSGTSARLMIGLLAGQIFDSELIGDKSLMKRPMLRVVNPLRDMNAEISCSDKGTLPINIIGGCKLHGIEYELPVASAQLKSCLLLAGLYAEGVTTIIEHQATRDHTERMLSAFSHPITRHQNRISICKADRLMGTDINIPADFSSASFFIVAATIAPGSDIVLENVGINPTRDAMLKIMELMGADIKLENKREQSGEPVADIHIKSSELCGINIPKELVPIAIDEFPIIMIAASCAKGETRLSGAAELRVKESDRIQSMLDGFIATGIRAEDTEDGMVIQESKFNGGVVNSHGDHRIAMAFAIAGLVSKETIVVNDCENVATSFPGFVELAQKAGVNITYV
ncbi:MAG: 3-phosphoshikimate 1-carboxyvinyltransferase [Legionellales bacterium]|nr:3-phosphoshikimate 1-carboxyvinyltransferase [Legionellales bacterium]